MCVCVWVSFWVCTLQVVHEAYRRFTEEYLMQSVCDETLETTEVTIKVSTGVQTCTLQLLECDNNQQKRCFQCLR